MGPSCRRGKPKGSRKSRALDSLPSKSPAKTSHDSMKNGDHGADGIEAADDVCSTPKAERFRIPEIETCPPAPKKRRVVTNCSLPRTPIAFFAPPDIELFFYFALRGVSV